MSIRRTIGISILLLLAAVSHASIIECVGTATQVVNGNDTLFIFKDEIHLRSTIGNVTWYDADGKPVASGTDEIYPDEGGYYVSDGITQSTPVYVFLYSEPTSMELSVAADCGGTTLTLKGDTKPLTYTRLDGTQGTCARACSIDYNALAWNTEEWVDSAATVASTLRPAFHLPALYGPTPIKLCYDQTIREALGMDSACVEIDVPIDSIKAVKMQLMSLATTRGKEGEKSNERNRPTSQEIVTRNDKDIRYTFSEPGSYRVVCAVNNAICASDSMEVTVAVAESYLAVPNVFTPNGDGKNDEFRVAYRSLRDFHIWVYNRWGKLVYESTDPAKGWDGNINGRPAAEGAYFYVVRAMGTDAAKNASFMMKASYNKKKLNADESVLGIYQMSGDINLLRGK